MVEEKLPCQPCAVLKPALRNMHGLDLAACLHEKCTASFQSAPCTWKRDLPLEHLHLLAFLHSVSSNKQKRAQKIEKFKLRIQLDIEERRQKEAEHLVVQKKKSLDERTARRSNILRFWGRAQVSHRRLGGCQSIAKGGIIEQK